jgi:uncharacterized membrane protein required for colicin V production
VTPIETLWFLMLLVFAITGIVRGFLKELGVSLVLVVMLFALTRGTPYMPQLLDMATNVVKQPVKAWVDRDAVWLVFYLTVVVGVVFISYQGYVVTYPGSNPKGMQGTLLALMVGVINGYLAIGTAWYYVHKYETPVRALGLLQYDYTPLAQKILKVLPPELLAPYLPFLVVFMIVLLVLK